MTTNRLVTKDEKRELYREICDMIDNQSEQGNRQRIINMLTHIKSIHTNVIFKAILEYLISHYRAKEEMMLMAQHDK